MHRALLSTGSCWDAGGEAGEAASGRRLAGAGGEALEAASERRLAGAGVEALEAASGRRLAGHRGHPHVCSTQLPIQENPGDVPPPGVINGAVEASALQEKVRSRSRRGAWRTAGVISRQLQCSSSSGARMQRIDKLSRTFEHRVSSVGATPERLESTQAEAAWCLHTGVWVQARWRIRLSKKQQQMWELFQRGALRPGDEGADSVPLPAKDLEEPHEGEAPHRLLPDELQHLHTAHLGFEFAYKTAQSFLQELVGKIGSLYCDSWTEDGSSGRTEMEHSGPLRV
ncbi:hypothetical protein CYMTET_5546 [Cymbomonas tetramitiformis]|uniref:Uncharacterized protein n=1 Tax=Cymbomonas tetramitiformis TaxID=36881 RepID=A0AAE0LIZ1_9CHLO|nr:hypothetical protein CYMTET_5546 [Cymbomonas tetramitiformis]